MAVTGPVRTFATTPPFVLATAGRTRADAGTVHFGAGGVASVTGEARAFWLRAPGLGEIRPAAVPSPGPDDVTVRTLFTGISRGTETLVFAGRVPDSQRTAMRAPFQEGDFPA